MEDCYPGPRFDKCVLHVPEESIEAYRNAPGWSNFVNIVAIEEDDSAIDEVETDEQLVPFVIADGEVTIECPAGSTLDIYDAGGLCLESHHPETATTVIHKGSGVRVIRLNGESYKISL